MTGVGTAGGAGTVVNAFATGRGVAFGLAARVRATVDDARRDAVYAHGRRLRPPEARLALATKDRVQAHLRRRGPMRIDVASDIPPQRGLKSSSAVGVAVARAVADHHRTRLTRAALLDLVARAATQSRTSLTGALDDAAACLDGGLVFTDNTRRRVLHRGRLPDGLVALVHVPRRRIATGSLDRARFRPIAPIVSRAWTLARAGHVRDAMLANTAAYAPLLGLRPQFTFDALEAGAWAAGLSGKGPAEVALVARDRVDRIRSRLPTARLVDVRHPGGDAA